MKRILILLAIIATSACTSSLNTNKTTLFYSGSFKLNIDTHTLAGAKIFVADGPAIKFTDEKTISGLIITRQSDSLPDDFILSEYPAYALGIKAADNLPVNTSNKFKAAAAEIKSNFNTPQIITDAADDTKTTYTACNANACILFIVKKNTPDHILMLTGNGFSTAELLSLTKGI